ncbi:hypothetical protein BGZ95_004433 [Linnemannia exigua]|uniref:Uncharacterized protein n=1 Tax=Linnemannia exigua TaxID=604196 RepID=A0AAD4H8Z1_9FUNG|nr:hypothetical protein BGZ95_004433 [Linnemannia exigua]
MNALVNYGTDSESEDEDNLHSASIQVQSTKLNNQDKEDEDDPILAALKDLQDFAASVNDSENRNDNVTQQTSSSSNIGSGGESVVQQDDDELKFLSFLQEIDAIPNPDEPQLPAPPPPPPAESPIVIDYIPPPPPPPLPPSPSDTTTIPPALSLSSQALSGTATTTTTTTATPPSTTESIQESVQMIYNRLYYISLLPSASSAFQDLERRLLEFAIRIVDWTKGGMEEAYFLGPELADALAKEAAATCAMEVDGSSREEVGREETALELPDFGGIVGSMIQYMFRLEQMATPNGWMAVWDTQDEAYGFQHVRTGLYSPVYPSIELINTLDPPAAHVRVSPTTYKSNNSWNYYSSTTLSSSPSTPTVTSPTVTMTAPALNPWAAPTATSATGATGTLSPSVGSDGLAQSPSLSTTNAAKQSPSETGPGTTKKKKRKLEDSSASGTTGDDRSLFDQSIHPSRRAALVKNGGVSPASSSTSSSGGGGKVSSSSSSSSKVMPKKLASLLQKWNEKEAEVSDDEEDEENTEGRQQQHQQDSSRTGANSQSLGGDWRDRRQQHHYK